MVLSHIILNLPKQQTYNQLTRVHCTTDASQNTCMMKNTYYIDNASSSHVTIQSKYLVRDFM